MSDHFICNLLNEPFAIIAFGVQITTTIQDHCYDFWVKDQG